MVGLFSEDMIINISLIGLGLLVALYTIFSDRINDLRENRNIRFMELSKKEIKKINELKTIRIDFLGKSYFMGKAI